MPTLRLARGGEINIDARTLTTVGGVLAVGQIEASAIAGTGAALNNVLAWNGTAWAPAASSGGNSVSVGVTTSGDSFASAVVTGQTWVTANTELVATFADHPTGVSAEEAAAEGAVVTVGAIVAGTGFTVYVHVPGGGVGPYRVHVVGV